MDKLLGPRFVVVTRVGITELGDSIVVIDEHSVNVSIPETGNEQPLRVPLSTIEAVSSTDEEIELRLRDGTKITFVARSTPPIAGPANIPTLEIVFRARFDAVSSSGVRARPGSRAACRS